MSLSIVFRPCRFTGTTVVKKNPFTGIEQNVATNEPLNVAELQAVDQLLKQVTTDGPDDFGFYIIEWDGGGVAEVDCGDLANGCTVTLRGVTSELFQFLFDLLKSAEWVMIPAKEDLVAITTSPERLKGIPKDFPKIVECHSAEELGVLLSDGIQAWGKHRRQVIGDE